MTCGDVWFHPENSWEFSSCKCAKKRGLQENTVFEDGFQQCFIIVHWSYSSLNMIYPQMPTEIWSRFRFRLNGFQVQPTTQYIDQFRVGYGSQHCFNRSTACQPLVTETAMQAWNVRLCPARLVACGSAYWWFHVHHGTFPAFESRGLSSQLRPQVVPDFTFNIGRIRILNAFADRKWIPA